MKLKKSEKIEANCYELEVEVEAEEFENALNAAYKRKRNSIRVPGFRKGKATRGVMEKLYGPELFYNDAVNALYPKAMNFAVHEAGVKVVDDNIDVDVVSIGKDGFVFKAKVTVSPEVKVGEYKGLKAKRAYCEVTDEEIDEEVEKLRRRNSRLVTVGRAAETGDIAVIDFEGFKDGVAFEGGKAENHALELGSGQFIPGFEDQIVGHSAGDEFDVNVTFPEDYGVEDLAGKPAVFKVKLHEIKFRELPEADDEFAKDVSEFDTIAELRTDLGAKVLAVKVREADEAVENALLEQLRDGLDADIPEAMVERRINDNMHEFEASLQQQGVNLEMYLKYTGITEEDLRKDFRVHSENQVKVRLALEKIAELEGIKATDEDVDAQIAKYAESYGVEPEQIKNIIPREEIEDDIVSSKALELVKTEAKITNARKPRAKKSADADAQADSDEQASE